MEEAPPVGLLDLLRHLWVPILRLLLKVVAFRPACYQAIPRRSHNSPRRLGQKPRPIRRWRTIKPSPRRTARSYYIF